jgi:hypothetical protein
MFVTTDSSNENKETIIDANKMITDNPEAVIHFLQKFVQSLNNK